MNSGLDIAITMPPDMSRHTRTLCILLLCCIPAACTTTPTAPTPGPNPAPPPPAPSPATRIIEFTPDTPTPVGEAIALTIAVDPVSLPPPPREPGTIWLAVTAFNLANHTTLGDPGVAGIWGRVKWNDALLEFQDRAGPGEFLFQGGVGPSCCRPGEAFIQQVPGTLPFSLQRPPGSPQVTGNGQIFLFQLRPREGVVEGTGRVEFESIAPSPWPELIRLRPLPTYQVPQNVYGGTITIR